MTLDNLYIIFFFSIISGIVVAAEVKNLYGRKRVQIRRKGENRENLKEIAKSYFIRMKNLIRKRGEMLDIDENEPPLDISIPKMEVAIFSEEILEKIKNLGVPADIVDELLVVLKDIPPEKRLEFLDSIFI